MLHKQSELMLYPLILSGELEVDLQGQVWRLARRTGNRWTGGAESRPCSRVRAEFMNEAGYLQVRAMIDWQRHVASAARLTWLFFRGPIPQGLTVNHMDGVKHNNHPLNLELATYSEQRLHAIHVLGARHHDVKGSKNPKATITEAEVLEMRRLRAAGWMVKSIAQRYGVTQNAASQICLGTTWKHVPLLLNG